MTRADDLAQSGASQAQLQRYAQDLGMLASDYDKLQRDFALASRNHDKARDMQQAFEAMVRSLDNFGFVTTAADGAIHAANGSAATLLGASADSLPGRALAALLDHAGGAAVGQELARLADSGGGESFACRPRGRAAARLNIRATRVPQAEAPGYRVNWLLRDEQALEPGINNEVFAALFSKASHAVMVTDRDARILSVNAAFSSITGYAESEVLGRSPHLLSSDRQDRAFFAAMWQALHDDGEWQGEIWNRRKNGEIYQQWLHITGSRDAGGAVSSYVAMFYDIDFARKAHERIYHLAHYDALTGLPNRALFNDRLGNMLALAQREQRSFGVLFLDLDCFKEINDSLGHDAGDEVLREFARRVGSTMRASDTVARMGGDEFVVLAHNVGDAAGVHRLADKILAALAQPVRVAGHDLYMASSIGAACYPEHGTDPSTLLSNADAAMYVSKRAGGNSVRIYSEEFNRGRLERLNLTGALRQALQLGQLRLAYQPQIDSASGQVCGVEALLRWSLPGSGDISPERFIPIAEETGLIIQIGAWVLEQACAQQVAWCAQGLAPLRMAVNVAARQLHERDFVSLVEATIARSGIDPRQLELEVTESQLMDSLAGTVVSLCRLRSLGVSIAVDDFGTGYSSLGRLHSLPIDRLKIDRSFVQAIDNGSNGDAIARAILAMAQSLGLSTVAEGVETQAQLAHLRASSCAEMQGFIFAPALAPEAIPAFLRGAGKAAA